VEDLVGPAGLAAADAAARTWARVWGRLPLADGRSFREMVEWRGRSLLWCVEGALRTATAGPRCARTAELALRVLEASGASEVEAAGLADADALLLSRAATVRGILFHGAAPRSAPPLRVAPAPGRGPGRLLAAVLARAAPPPLPPPLVGGGHGAAPVVALLAGREEREALAPALGAAAAELWRPVVVLTTPEIARWETRRARRSAARAEALLRDVLGRLRGTPGLVESYAHRGVSFADLAAADLPALLRGHLPAAVQCLESAVELFGSARSAAVLLAVPGRDERRTLLLAAEATSVPAVSVRLGARGEDDAWRADGGPQPLAELDWEPESGPGPLVARLGEAARGRVEPA
jgi:hypothetical protein